jgi:hypothetical protein
MMTSMVATLYIMFVGWLLGRKGLSSSFYLVGRWPLPKGADNLLLPYTLVECLQSTRM